MVKIIKAIQLFNAMVSFVHAKKNVFLRGLFGNDTYIDIIKVGKLGNPRLPSNLGCISKNLYKNALFDAGKTIILETDSNELDVIIAYRKVAILNNMNIGATSAIDVVIENKNERRVFSIATNSAVKMYVNRRICLDGGKSRVKIYLPSYAKVENLYIGVKKNSNTYVYNDASKPVVFYGSSITQGCCASSPTKSYAHMIADHYGLSIRNFGFSESAKGEHNVIEYIASVPAILFILEYDHNADVELLRHSHYSTYKQIRSTNPTTPIIFLSRFSGGLSISKEEEEDRVLIIKSTLDVAYAEGDQNVYFVSGKNMIRNKQKCFVDDRHPNDYGMKIIAESIIKCIDENEILVIDNDNK